MDPSPFIQPSPILTFFEYSHLPYPMQEVSKKFYDLAWTMEHQLPPGPEKSVSLRKLLEAKDCAVRCVLPSAG